METLNYFREAAQKLRNYANNTKPEFPEYKKHLLEIVEMGVRAQKFILPEGGCIFSENLEKTPEEFNLPFEEVLIEYHVDSSAGTELGDEMRKYNAKIVPADKRIIIAKQIKRNEIVIFSIFYAQGKWNIQNYGLYLTITLEDLPAFKVSSTSKNLIETNIGFDLKPFPCIEKTLPRNWKQMALLDMSEEVRVITEFIDVLSCSNVTSEKIINNKNNIVKSKKESLFENEYHVLKLKHDDSANSTTFGLEANSGESNERRSPREHLRRGHYRQYGEKKIFIEATVVKKGTVGKIEKSYLFH